jgi:hypothetical protein
MIAKASVVTKDVVSVYDFIKDVSLQPCLLYEVYVELFEFHGNDEVFVYGVIVWVVRSDISV